MRVFAAVLLASVFGCETMSLDEHQMISRGLSEDELNAGPSDNEIRGGITTDVRKMWIPEAELDKGRPTCTLIRFDDSAPVCLAHEEPVPMKVFTIRSDSPDRQYPVQETAYFCPAESIYWYHYEGGDQRRNVWMGPRRLKLRKAQGVPFKDE